MNKYRIVHRGDYYYVIQKKFMFFFWSDLYFFNRTLRGTEFFLFLDNAILEVKRLIKVGNEDRIVWTETGDKDE
jgi:hypothetical protein